MDNIKKFEDFLDRMQGLLDNAKKQGHIIVRAEDLESTFPELKESKDERIRKELIELISCMHDADQRKERWIAWLEKQGEQKPVFEMKTPEESLGIDSDTYNKIVDECIYGEQNPAWSEKDEEMCQETIDWFEKKCFPYALESENPARESIKWLKSLRKRIEGK